MVRWVNAAVYGAIAVGAAAALAQPLADSARALAQPFTLAPRLALPWLWPVLAAALALATAEAARRLFAGRGPGLARYAALLVVAALCVSARRLVPQPAAPAPGETLAALAVRLEKAATRSYEAEQRYPVDAGALQAALPEELRHQGYWARGGRRLRSRVEVRAGAFEPALVAGERTRPGDLVFAVDDARRRCWITAFVLDGRGRVVPAADEAGRARVLASSDGRPAGRLDPLFPEYPRKSAPRPGTRPGP